MTISTISAGKLAELCRGKKIDLIDVRTPVELSLIHI